MFTTTRYVLLTECRWVLAHVAQRLLTSPAPCLYCLHKHVCMYTAATLAANLRMYISFVFWVLCPVSCVLCPAAMCAGAQEQLVLPAALPTMGSCDDKAQFISLQFNRKQFSLICRCIPIFCLSENVRTCKPSHSIALGCTCVCGVVAHTVQMQQAHLSYISSAHWFNVVWCGFNQHWM